MSEGESDQTTSEQEVPAPSSRKVRTKREDNSEAQDKKESKQVLSSLNEQEALLKEITKGIDRQSKEMANLEVRIKRLEKNIGDVDKNLNRTITFIHNRGWKKKKNK